MIAAGPFAFEAGATLNRWTGLPDSGWSTSALSSTKGSCILHVFVASSVARPASALCGFTTPPRQRPVILTALRRYRVVRGNDYSLHTFSKKRSVECRRLRLPSTIAHAGPDLTRQPCVCAPDCHSTLACEETGSINHPAAVIAIATCHPLSKN